MIFRFQALQLSNPNRLFARIFGPLWNRRNAALNDAVFEQLDLQPDDRVLEVGFGGGYLMSRMAARVTQGFLAGVDISPAMLASAQKRFRAQLESGQVDLRCARAESLPFAAGQFSKACSVNSIFYWGDVPRALTELCRVLAGRGRLVLCQTGAGSLRQKRFADYVNRFDAQQLARMVAAAGFGEIAAHHAADQYRAYFCLTASTPVTQA